MLSRIKFGSIVVLALLVMVGAWSCLEVAAEQQDAATQTAYVCAMGGPMVANVPGHCPCGKPLIEKPVLREDAQNVYVCACESGCSCQLDPADDSKCTCGKPLQAFSKIDQPAGCKASKEKVASTAPCANCNHRVSDLQR